MSNVVAPLMAVVMAVGGASFAGLQQVLGIDWRFSPERIASSCKAEIQRARTRVRAAAEQQAEEVSLEAGLVAVETAIADMHDALVAQKLLASVSPDKGVRDASARCNDDVAAFSVEVAADPAIYAHALAAKARATAQADKQLATLYVEAGRRAGAHLDAAARTELVWLSDRR
jgi:Zn-dependent oligopeptidase